MEEEMADHGPPFFEKTINLKIEFIAMARAKAGSAVYNGVDVVRGERRV